MRHHATRSSSLLALFIGAVGGACAPAPSEVTVETQFALEASPVVETALWECAVALDGERRGSDALRLVFHPDGSATGLEAATADLLVQTVSEALGDNGAAVLVGSGGAEAARAVIDAELTAIVPIHIEDGARAVLVTGYRTHARDDGTCTALLKDMLVVDTVEVMAYGIPVADYHARLAGLGVVAVAPTSDALADIDTTHFSPGALPSHAAPPH